MVRPHPPLITRASHHVQPKSTAAHWQPVLSTRTVNFTHALRHNLCPCIVLARERHFALSPHVLACDGSVRRVGLRPKCMAALSVYDVPLMSSDTHPRAQIDELNHRTFMKHPHISNIIIDLPSDNYRCIQQIVHSIPPSPPRRHPTYPCSCRQAQCILKA